ncbi:hypothetical protein T552_01400 [Pneumocystis carinii B80]|uniref:Kynurenine 3-monooxygenase n=1 Tax=Pneumocystis carinii (strain B80) TaxID=1408658 RepID=A0A0W4ZK68_PNEC8|nr:hypothetical protein T552_01400 [Pneumocystis carinii B80]KTW28770.1 hypothetical protein T552_01400 [Pneumocystis carinii B80]
MENIKKIAIVGGGPVGALSALFFGKNGWEVELYERRHDIRNSLNDNLSAGKSINLALSERGIESLRHIGLDKVILENAIPMYGRMIHSREGKQTRRKYDVYGRYINSIDRKWLTAKLLNEAEKLSNVKLFFDCKVVDCDFDTGTVWFRRSHDINNLVKTNVDFIIGCDGVYSTVRQSLEKKITVDFEKKYIDSMWCEFSIPALIKNEEIHYAIDPNYLHIWPRKTFMFIALPNTNKTFTCTLFMPKTMFEKIETEHDLLELFEQNFPDLINLIGHNELVKQFFTNPKSPLVTIKCKPHFYKSKCVIIGDASHCMVPFYGQGMNCGFEDVRLLYQLINSNSTNLEKALINYSNTRYVDVVAMCDLALHNWEDMRTSISQGYAIKKIIEDFLYLRFPLLGIVPLYTMISFSNIRYSLALEKWKRQRKILDFLIYMGGIGTFGSIMYFATRIIFKSMKFLTN